MSDFRFKLEIKRNDERPAMMYSYCISQLDLASDNEDWDILDSEESVPLSRVVELIDHHTPAVSITKRDIIELMKHDQVVITDEY